MSLIRSAALACVLAALAAGPAAANSMWDYGMKFSDATVIIGSDPIRIYVHKSRNTFMMQPAMSTIMGGGGHFPESTWRLAAEKFVYNIGCGISDVVAFSKAGATWEATYVCPDGVDLRALVAAQRDALKHGEPLHGGLPPPIGGGPAAPPVADPHKAN
jgi:hypothetical protein